MSEEQLELLFDIFEYIAKIQAPQAKELTSRLYLEILKGSN